MALLDQLFRLRGAPRAPTPPVTLGALVAALKDTPLETDASDEGALAAVAPSEGCTPDERPAIDPKSLGVTVKSDPVSDAAQGESKQVEPPITPPAPSGPQRRSATRFNPFAPVAE